jgi:membrane protease YdiL (CAAX protease family)
MIADANARNPNKLSERTRWIIHVAILCVPILLSVFSYSIGHHAKLPQTGLKLAKFVSLELLMWGFAFAAAFRMSRITMTQLCLRAGSVLGMIIYGLGCFILVRIVVAIILFIQLRLAPSDSEWASSEAVFSMMDAHSIALHPVFSLTVFGITSLLAGLTEEMWRVGMLRGLQAIFPSFVNSQWGVLACIAIVSLVFGVAHLYLGWLGVENAILLGFVFGLIVVYRQSYWEAAIAHTLFDASSFALVAFIALHPQILSAAIVAEASKGNIPMVNHLLQVGGDVNARLGEGKFSTLEMAEFRGHRDMVSFLLEKGADPNLKDKNGNTVLIYAAENDDLGSIKLLAKKGANLNAINEKGQTALRIAVESKHPDVVQLLIDLGANVNIADDQGTTPLEFARKSGYANSAELLEKNGGK